LSRILRGSKKVRKILLGKEPITISQNLKRFSELTDTIVDQENSKKINLLWTHSFWTNSTKTFLFKLHNNLLGLNSRVAKFVQGHPSSCTFCDIQRTPDYHPESTIHRFFECPVTENILTEFYTWVLNSQEVRHVSRSEFFVAFNFENPNINSVFSIVNCIVKKYLWECKNRFSLPSIEHLKLYFKNETQNIFSISNKVRQMVLKSGLQHNNINFRF
jgi:hypothetical protein